MYECVAFMHVHVSCAWLVAVEFISEAQTPCKWSFQMIVNHHVGAVNCTKSSTRVTNALTSKPSVLPSNFCFYHSLSVI